MVFSVFYCVLLPFGVINDDDDDIVQWGDRSLVEMVRQAENRKGYRCLVYVAAYARTSGTVS